jgi:hypothetical protein
MFAKGLVEDGKCFTKDFHDLGVVSIVKVKATERTARSELQVQLVGGSARLQGYAI